MRLSFFGKLRQLGRELFVSKEDKESLELLVLVCDNCVIESFDELRDIFRIVVIDPDLDLWQNAIGSRGAGVGTLVRARHMLRVERRYHVANVEPGFGHKRRGQESCS